MLGQILCGRLIQGGLCQPSLYQPSLGQELSVGCHLGRHVAPEDRLARWVSRGLVVH